MVPRQSPDIVNIEVEGPSYFRGGEMAWRSFSQKNLNPSAPVKNGAPASNYAVQLQFKVANDGSISDIQPATTIGYGLENAVKALMQQSPKGVPAEQNGYKETTIHKQNITFVVAEK